MTMEELILLRAIFKINLGIAIMNKNEQEVLEIITTECKSDLELHDIVDYSFDIEKIYEELKMLIRR